MQKRSIKVGEKTFNIKKIASREKRFIGYKLECIFGTDIYNTKDE